MFEAIAGSEVTGSIGIDDILIIPEVCPPLGSCTFESGMCTWQNSKNSDDFDWIRAAGETLTAGAGPTNDHTLGSPHGKICFFRSCFNLSVGKISSMRENISKIEKSIQNYRK